MVTLWHVEDRADRVVGLRRSFRAQVAAVAADGSDIDAAELIYGELVGNAERHAGGGSVEVRLEVAGEGRPTLVVRDHGPGLRRRASSDDPLAESGRGLAIVETLARGFAVTDAPDGGTEARAVLPVLTRS